MSFVIITVIFAQITGDINDDGSVNILDLTYIASYIGESVDATQTPNPDINGDGTVNILDIVLVAGMIGDGVSDKNTLVFGRGGDSITLDPSQVLDGESAKVCDMIFDTLVQYREDTTEIEPALAEMWDNSADGLTWTFYMRHDVQFHDGTPCNAYAAAFSLNRPNAQTASFYGEFINQIVAIDEFTLQVNLKTPYAPFLTLIASTENSIVSPNAVEKFGEEFVNNPIGTGPFKFVQWIRNDKIELNANETH